MDIRSGHPKVFYEAIISKYPPEHTYHKIAVRYLSEIQEQERVASVESSNRADKQHDEKHSLATYSARLATAGFILSVLVFLAGRYWPTSQVSLIERRVAELDQRVTALEKPLVSDPPQTSLPTQPQTTSKEQRTKDTKPNSSMYNPAALTTPAPKTTP